MLDETGWMYVPDSSMRFCGGEEMRQNDLVGEFFHSVRYLGNSKSSMTLQSAKVESEMPSSRPCK